MKKIFSLVLVVVLTATLLSACSSGSGSKLDGMTPQEIIDKLYSGVSEDVMPMMVQSTKIDSTNEEYYLGTMGLKFDDAVASESAVGSIAFSICVVKMTDGEDIAAAKADIKSKVNPNKWICVGVDPENVVVESSGNYVILIMTENSKAFLDSFNKLIGK